MNRIQFTIFLTALAAVSPFLHAAPAGFEKGALQLDHTCAGVFVVDADGLLYYGHDIAILNRPAGETRGTRGNSNQIWTRNPMSGAETLFYDAADHPGSNQINSAGGIAIDETVTPWVYYIADQSPRTPPDPYSSGCLWKASDLNGDGDINDPGETALMTADNAVIYIEGVIHDPDTGNVYVSSAEYASGTTMVYRMRDDVTPNGFFEPEEIHSFFLEPDTAAAGKLARNAATGVIYTVNSAGSVYALDDINGNGVIEVGEFSSPATGLIGGFGIAVDPHGNVFVSASSYPFPHYIYRIDALGGFITVFQDLSAELNWSGPIVFDRGSSFQAGVTSAVLYANYTPYHPSEWTDTDELITFRGDAPDVPAMSPWALLAALMILGALLKYRIST